MYRTTGLPNTRIRVADALRGIAVAGIILIHACEHFNLYWAGLPYRRALVEGLEEPVAEFMWWLLAGKMYTIFALLFGLSFYVQSDNQAQRGRSFTGRFTWRMVLLLGIGLVNTAFYNGDVLVLYALLGVRRGSESSQRGGCGRFSAYWRSSRSNSSRSPPHARSTSMRTSGATPPCPPSRRARWAIRSGRASATGSR